MQEALIPFLATPLTHRWSHVGRLQVIGDALEGGSGTCALLFVFLSFSLPGHEVTGHASLQASCEDVLLHTGPKAVDPTNHLLKSPKLLVKINLFSL